MQAPPAVFSQITAALYPAEFSRCVERFPNARPPRGLSEYDHFLALCFGQLTYRESLRDIVACLRSKPGLLYHLGFRGQVSAQERSGSHTGFADRFLAPIWLTPTTIETGVYLRRWPRF